MKVLKMQSKKQGGFVLTSELVFLATILVIGLTVGLVTMRDALTAEMEDVAEAIGNLDQSYAFDGITNPQNTAATEGSAFSDAVDVNAGDGVAFDYLAVDISEASSITAPAGPSAAADGPAADGSVTP